jgi:hypothetical protein
MAFGMAASAGLIYFLLVKRPRNRRARRRSSQDSFGPDGSSIPSDGGGHFHGSGHHSASDYSGGSSDSGSGDSGGGGDGGGGGGGSD